MNVWLDDSLVGLVLILSALYVLAALGPKNVRRRTLAALAALLARAPAALRLRPAAERLARAADAKTQGACGGCDNCGAGAETRTSNTGGEINVPIASIARARPRQDT
jgi:hypothetical protein